MVLGKKDINGLRILNGFQSNYRDASMGSTGGGTVPWKNGPTVIQAPTNRSFRFNPYSGRTGDNLKETNHARAAVLTPVVNPSSDDLPRLTKRKRVEPTFAINAPYTSRSAHSNKKRGGTPRIASETINVDDDEDIGVPVIQAREPSPDQRSIIPETPGKPERPVTEWQPAAGPSRNLTLSPSSPIESADGMIERAGPPGKVKAIVEQFEGNVQKAVPHYDLKRKMKPKGGRTQGKVQSTFETHITPQERSDAIATASTSYHHGGRKGKQKEKSRPQELCLPVKEWCLGLLHYEEPCHIYFSSASHFIRIDGPAYIEELPLSLIKSVELPTWKGDFDFTSALPVVKITTLPGSKRETFGARFKDYFTRGEKVKGFVTFKLDAADESWSDKDWKCLEGLLKGAVTEGKGACQSHLFNANNALWSLTLDEIEATYSQGGVNDNLTMSETPGTLDAAREKLSSSDNPRLRRTSMPSSSHSADAKTVRSRPSKPELSSKPNPFQPKQPVQENQTSGLRRSSRHEPQAKRKSPVEDPEEVILCYPPATTGAVNITNGDLSRLQPGEYLNDTLIEFGLKLWHKELEQNSPELAEQIYIFNSFFYKKLNKKNIEESYKTVARWTNKIDLFKKKYVIVPINENFHWYLAVIYQPEYALLPPEEKPVPATRGRTRLSQAHSAADATAGDTGEPNDPTNDQPEESTTAGTSDTAVGVDSTEALDTLSNDNDEPDMDILATVTVSHDDDMESVTAMDCDEEDAESAASVTAHLTQPDPSVADDDDINMAEADDVNMTEDDKATVVDIEETEAREEPQNAVAIPPDNFYGTTTSGKEKEGISEPLEIIASEGGTPQPLTTDISKPIPYIFIMDSLCQKHPKVVNVLSSYLKYEAIEKKKKDATDITKPAGKYAQVPLQPNFCDCGLYLLHFARTFVEKTDYLVKIMTRDRSPRTPQADRHEDWNARGVEGHRQQLAERIKELSMEWRKEKAEREAGEELERKKREAIEVPDSDSDDEMEIVQENLATSKKKPTKQNTNRPNRLR
ncbi:hypothetical protein PQX77_000603 [Marasmius sp. AFHP31]|nr:hypothetical protein PQX77_000603 [Marasmius sp. AFHP31]